MSVSDLLITLLTDPFRIGLMIALVITTFRNMTNTGRFVPLIAGVVFVAVIIPATLQTASIEPFWRLVGFGAFANGIILAIILGLCALYSWYRR